MKVTDKYIPSKHRFMYPPLSIRRPPCGPYKFHRWSCTCKINISFRSLYIWSNYFERVFSPTTITTGKCFVCRFSWMELFLLLNFPLDENEFSAHVSHESTFSSLLSFRVKTLHRSDRGSSGNWKSPLHQSLLSLHFWCVFYNWYFRERKLIQIPILWNT